VKDDKCLIHLCRYIHRNPLEANLVSEVGLWKYSDYQEWISGKKNSRLISDLFSGSEGYKSFVTEYETSTEEVSALTGYLFD
jgi:hypothetical protein